MNMLALQILSILGFVVSLYAYIVERKYEKDKKYKAVCDISDNMSCKKAFTSEYGKIFGISNSFIGMLFYVGLFVLTLYNFSNIIFYMSWLSFAMSVYLAYISFIKMKNFCLVCTSIYIINILLLFFSYSV